MFKRKKPTPSLRNSATSHNRLLIMLFMQSAPSHTTDTSKPDKLGASKKSDESGNGKVNTLFKEKYSTGEILGQGSYSVVKLGTRIADGKKVAVKIVSRHRLQREDELSLRIEVEVLMSLNHPNIVQALDFFEEDDYFYVVLEYLDGGELFERLMDKAVYTEGEARDLFTVLLNAVKYCHDRDLVHRCNTSLLHVVLCCVNHFHIYRRFIVIFYRDIKPENILMTSKTDDINLKLADFGFAVKSGVPAAKQQAGTPGYIAPEILQGKPHGSLSVYGCVKSVVSKLIEYIHAQASPWICGLSAWCCTCCWVGTHPSTSPRTTRRPCSARS